MSPFRQLLPAAPPANDGDSSSSSATTPSSTGPSQKPPGKNRADVACTPCRKRRSKCNGARPVCLRCAQSGLECEYEVPQAEAMKRKLDDLEEANKQLVLSEERLRQRASAYEELIEILRTRPEHEVSPIVSRIRSGEQAVSVVRLVKDGDLLLQLRLDPAAAPFCFQFPLVSAMPSFLLDLKTNPYINSILYHQTLGEEGQRIDCAQGTQGTESGSATPESSEGRPSATTPTDDTLRMYQVPFHAGKLAEPRLDLVKASRWTSVTSSDTLVRDLLELYFVHEFTSCCVFHMDHFLNDMVSGRERYCSSLLVNAILALACHGHKGLDNRAHFWNPKSLYYQFMAEFKRLWELESSEHRITTVQAGVIICVSHNVDGLDKVGTSFLAQAVTMGREMGIFSAAEYASLNPKRKAVYTVTAQGIYAWESIQSFCFLRCPFVTTRPLPFPPLDEVHYSKYAGELWLQFPGAQHPVPCHHGLSFRYIVAFRQIMCDVADRVYGQGKSPRPLSFLESMGYRKRLLYWFDHLPPPLRPDRVVTPTDLKLHLHYYNLMTLLFEPFVAIPLESLGGHMAGGEASPAAVVSHSNMCYETVFRFFYLRHGFDLWDSCLIHYSTIASFSAISRLQAMQQPELTTNQRQSATFHGVDRRSRDEALSSLILCTQGLRDHARYSLLSEFIFRLLRGSLTTGELSLLRDHGVDLEPREGERMLATYVRSLYPVGMVGVADDPQGKRMDTMIQSYRRLEVSSQDDPPSPTSLSIGRLQPNEASGTGLAEDRGGPEPLSFQV
ncbi:hypothetical protein RB601_006007 [Gaeumannomyces tritici]